MAHETPEPSTDIDTGRLDGESGVGAGDPSITSTDEPAPVLPDDAPDHRSGLETEAEPGTEKADGEDGFSGI